MSLYRPTNMTEIVIGTEVNEPPMTVAEAKLLGFQHYHVMIGKTVLIPTTLVPQWVEEKAKMIQTLLYVADLSTLTQTLFGTCLPAIIGDSFTFVPTTISIILAGRYSDIADPQEGARSEKNAASHTLDGADVMGERSSQKEDSFLISDYPDS
ncbi:nucleobase-ascorbate transporter 7 [Artemisia annua]|uniref:Nucleobase-ascorbate transporter 7 n=1 Tax=Artemisia annua TaxID=35608 RepID=A0A2U1QLY7_ARTAN|nr:nucleobase-ascorbate transporter 7 [Artemisia annua]